MKNIIRSFVIAGAISLPHAAAAQQQGERLTLEAAVAMAMAQNRSVAMAGRESGKATHDVSTAKSRRLPQFGVDATVSELLRPINVHFPQGAFGTYPAIGPIPATDTSITTAAKPAVLVSAQLTQPLTQLYEIGLNVRVTEAALALARESERSARLAVAYEVKRLYYSLLQNESALAATDHSATMLRELGRVVGNRVIQKAALRADALDVDTRVARLEQQRLTLMNAIATQKEQINRLLGRDVRTMFDTAGVPEDEIAAADLEMAQSRAIESRPELRQARLKIAQAQLAHRIAKADRLPEVSVALSYYSPMNIDGAPQNIASVGVQLQWEPFDWGRKSRVVAARRLSLEQAELALQDDQDRVLIEVGAQHRRLNEARMALRVAAMTQEQARETSRVRADQYRVQAVLLSDVLQAAAAQADADNQYQQALAGLWLAEAEFERALGEE
jgi:outer membrane protein